MNPAGSAAHYRTRPGDAMPLRERVKGIAFEKSG
ncbi:hypothetical protein GGD88_003650 [Roseospira goensis]|uniref:Uncharacterized protein n=1 Tax=Roseospira goensis TaxID=391922 RepID=A0A7W6S3X5_9PROT|nr:hypothetical protein [Roseospira goensis]